VEDSFETSSGAVLTSAVDEIEIKAASELLALATSPWLLIKD